ncbi:MAG: tetratricopeptide repeat protein [Deltaproteobacteria bacterium]|nr:tetratricopeptide repeat protein [Deltaproteobacteria bacterium]
MMGLSRKERIALWSILGLALALRVAFVLGQRSEVFFDTPQLDEAHYVDEARRLITGDSGDQDHLPYWQPPGIVYVLYATFKIAGTGLLAPRLVSAVVSAVSCLLLFAIARRLFGVRAGLFAAGVLAVHGLVIFQAEELLPATFAMALGLLTVWLLLVAADRKSLPLAGAAGLSLGASSLFVATLLPFALVGAIALRARRIAILVFAVGVAVPIVPVTIRNAVASGDLVMISANGGLNFYLGNNADYRATFSQRPGRRWEELVDEPHQKAGVEDATAAASSYFMHKGLSYFTSEPVSAIALLLRKEYLFFHGAEIARDSDIYAARDTSVLLEILVAPRPIDFPDGLLIPLALVGIVALWPERRRLAVPLAFLALQAALIPVFFVSARHRAPAIPFFVLFAVGGAPALWKRRVPAAIALVVLVVALNIPTWETRLSLAGEHELFRGKALMTRGDRLGAATAMKRATELAPDDTRAWFELGNAYDSMGRLPEAADAWSRAADLDPWDSRPRRREAVARSRMGDADGAIRAIETLLAHGDRDPAHYAPDHLNLAIALVHRGQIDRAIVHLRAAMVDPTYLRGALPKLAGSLLDSPGVQSPAFFHALADAARTAGLPELAVAADARANQGGSNATGP